MIAQIRNLGNPIKVDATLQASARHRAVSVQARAPLTGCIVHTYSVMSKGVDLSLFLLVFLFIFPLSLSLFPLSPSLSQMNSVSLEFITAWRMGFTVDRRLGCTGAWGLPLHSYHLPDG